MEKLELKHLSSYLPYGLKIKGNTHGDIEVLHGLKGGAVFIESSKSQYAWCDIDEVKPILRPLSDLGDYFKTVIETDDEVREILGNNFLFRFDIWIDVLKTCDYNFYSYAIFELFCKHHFDVYGLIEKGIAISIQNV
jgi:hypothetical protein